MCHVELNPKAMFELRSLNVRYAVACTAKDVWMKTAFAWSAPRRRRKLTSDHSFVVIVAQSVSDSEMRIFLKTKEINGLRGGV